MCIACSSFVPERRRFLSLAAAGVAAASMLGAPAFAAGATTSVTPDEALARLKAGNRNTSPRRKSAPSTSETSRRCGQRPDALGRDLELRG